MALNDYYREELVYLQEMGEEFSRAFPKLTPFLARKGNDPDIERLLEGFAFIAGRIRQKLDDELPELTHTLLSILWPNFLRPLPSSSILKFSPLPNAISEQQKVPRHVEVDSIPIDGTACRFRTSYDVDLYPLNIKDVEFVKRGASPELTIRFEVFSGTSLDQLNVDKLRFYIHGDTHLAQTLYLYLFQYLRGVSVQVQTEQGSQGFTLPPTALSAVGFAENEDLLPYPDNAFHGYRLLQEYFTLPQKFHFFEISGLNLLANLPKATEFEIKLEFNRPFDEKIRIETGNLLLYCTPIINIFNRDADPIRVDQKKLDYVIRPAGGDVSHYEIFKINDVHGWIQGSGEKRKYHPFLSYDHGAESQEGEDVFYKTKVAPSVVGRGLDTIVSFANSSDNHSIPQTETISIELTCTNRHLAEKLRVGDISRATSSSPEIAKFENIISPTISVPPPIGKGLHWMLISNMSLNYSSLASVEALRLILTTYNFHAHFDEQQKRVNELRMAGIEDVSVKPVTFLLQGAPVRGISTQLNMRSGKFGGEGEMYIFASILNEFFSLYSSINSFSQLVIRNIERGEEFRWKPRLGRQPLI